MSRYSAFRLLSCLLVLSLLAACSPAAPQAQAVTAVPAEATKTPVPPTNTVVPPTPTPTAPPLTSTPVPPTATQPPPTPVPKDLISFTHPQKYAVQYKVAIRNSGFLPRDLRVYLPLPVEWDEQKEIKVNQVLPEAVSSSVEKKSGNAMVYWQSHGLPKQNTTDTYQLDFDLIAYETNAKIEPGEVEPYKTDTAAYKMYTRAEKYIESTDSEIVKVANQVAGAETNPYLIAKKYYDYVIDHSRYELLGYGLNGARFLLRQGKGECGDYSALFVALCRAKGIPARPVVGYWAISGKEQTHVWAEFYLEAIGWVPVDPTIGQQSASKRTYYFGNMDNQRVILAKGYNTVLVPAGPDGYIAPLMQAPLWWYWGSGDDTKMSMDRNWTVSKKN